MKVTLINDSARDEWQDELGQYCFLINADCDFCQHADRCQELTDRMRHDAVVSEF
jgi:hypothetical protein